MQSSANKREFDEGLSKITSNLNGFTKSAYLIELQLIDMSLETQQELISTLQYFKRANPNEFHQNVSIYTDINIIHQL